MNNSISGARIGRKPGAAVLGLWGRAWLLALVSIAVGSLYFFIRQYFKDGVWRFDLYLFNKSLATSALFMISLSMLLTGICYFSSRKNSFLALRRFYGLAGFWTGLVHGVVSHFFLPEKFPLPRWLGENAAASALGIAALVLFGGMAAASNTRMKSLVGGEVWRKFLRYAGYSAMVAACLHAGALKWASWVKYFRTFESVLPSLSLPVVGLSAAALLLRLAVWLSQRSRNRPT